MNELKNQKKWSVTANYSSCQCSKFQSIPTKIVPAVTKSLNPFEPNWKMFWTFSLLVLKKIHNKVMEHDKLF